MIKKTVIVYILHQNFSYEMNFEKNLGRKLNLFRAKFIQIVDPRHYKYLHRLIPLVFIFILDGNINVLEQLFIKKIIRNPHIIHVY